MKKVIVFSAFVLSFVLASYAKAQVLPPPIPNKPLEGEYIHDELNWLNNDQKLQITTIASSLDNEELAELFVVTLDDCGTDKRAYRKQIFNAWEIGHADQDGLLILICWYGGDKARRSIEQEFGGGLENILSNSITDQVAKDQFVPRFDQGSPGDGLIAMTESYNFMIRSGPAAPIKTSKGFWFNKDFWFVMSIFLIIGVYIYNVRKNPKDGNLSDDRSHGGGYYGGDSGGGGDGGGSSTGF